MRALVTGTFDPITLGHLHVIKKASEAFDEVTVLLCENFDKESLFTSSQRKEIICSAVADMKNVSVEYHSGWLSDYLKENDNLVIFRGARNAKDFEYEKNMAEYHLENSGINTLITFSSEKYSNISSTLVRELISKRGDWEPLLHPSCVPLIREFLNL